MKQLKMSIVIPILLVGLLMASQASAQLGLISAPLERGSSGTLVCSCFNISSKTFGIELSIRPNTGSSANLSFDIPPGSIRKHSTANGSSGVCRIRDLDGRSVTRKQVKCTFSSVDGTNSPQATVPVDTKYKIPE